jgi:trehalose 6-phosphate phosphatase
MDAGPGSTGLGRGLAPPTDGRRRLVEGERPLVLLDLDGTLAPIVAHPDDARVEPAAIEAIHALASAGIGVAIVTGRPSAEAARLLGGDDVPIAGLYGLEGAPPIATEVVAALERAAASVPGAWVEPKGATVAVHVRASPPPSWAALAGELERIARARGLEVHAGKAVFDLVPAGVGRKGAAVGRLAADADAVAYAGDDLPDLEAFAALDRLAAGGVTVVRIAVADAGSPRALLEAADLVLPDPAALAAWLAALAADRQPGGRT